MPIDQLSDLITLFRQDILKGSSYACIFLTWLEQRNKNPPQFQRWFDLYQHLFHARRLFRIFSWIIYTPMIKNEVINLKRQFSFKSTFALLGHISIALFLLVDNLSIILMMMKQPCYRVLRRVSYSIFLIGIVWRIIEMAIRLKISFNQESAIKNQLQDLTPLQFLQHLNRIDDERKQIALEFVNLVGDFVPALARTNTPQILLRTKVNKGTVGFFGMVATLSGIIRKLKKWRTQHEHSLFEVGHQKFL